LLSTIQNKILEFHDIIGSLNFALYFLVSITAIVFSLCVLTQIFHKKGFGMMSRSKKLIFAAAALISIIFTLDMILAGDIYPSLSPESMARSFAKHLSNGEVEEITIKNKVLAPEYHGAFASGWQHASEDLARIQCEAKDFFFN
jgi:hypothetical protein